MSDWVKVDSSLPKIGLECIVVYNYYGNVEKCFAVYNGQGFISRGYYNSEVCNPLYWMQVPSLDEITMEGEDD